MYAIVSADRSIGDHDVTMAICMTIAIRKQPVTLTIRVPQGNELPKG